MTWSEEGESGVVTVFVGKWGGGQVLNRIRSIIGVGGKKEESRAGVKIGDRHVG
jgi:hypothetical protein